MNRNVLIFDSQADEYVTKLSAAVPELLFHGATNIETGIALGREAGVLMGLAPYIEPRLIAAMPQLRWIQALTTGTDNLLYQTPELDRNVLITSMRGIQGPQMAELVFLYMLALSRDLVGNMERQAEAKWLRLPQRLLLGRHAVLVGVGAIADAVASRCKAFGMKVSGVSTTLREAPHFDQIVVRSDLKRIAAEADFLIVLLPYDHTTDNLIGAEIIEAMKPDSLLINLSRGKIVDEDALLLALQQSKIAGAGLDVFATEPLPTDNPLWHCRNVIVTPHIGGMSNIYADQALPTLIDNCRSYVAGRMDLMHNVVREGGNFP